jgi:putative transposase
MAGSDHEIWRAGPGGGGKASYMTVHRIATVLDTALVSLAQEGERHYREAFDLIYCREAEGSNAIWQADHTELDMLVVDPPRPPARPWLT